MPGAPTAKPTDRQTYGYDMTRGLTFFFALSAAPALAHPGHIGEIAGHDHWLAGAAIGAAIGIAIWGAIKGKTQDGDAAEAEAAEETVEADPQEA